MVLRTRGILPAASCQRSCPAGRDVYSFCLCVFRAEPCRTQSPPPLSVYPFLQQRCSPLVLLLVNCPVMTMFGSFLSAFKGIGSLGRNFATYLQLSLARRNQLNCALAEQSALWGLGGTTGHRPRGTEDIPLNNIVSQACYCLLACDPLTLRGVL